jgi:hypothetical protein
MRMTTYNPKEDYKQVREKISSIKLTDTNCTTMLYFYSNLLDDMVRSDKNIFEKQFGRELNEAILEWGENEANLPWNYSCLDIWNVWKLNFETIGDFAEYWDNNFCPMCGTKLYEEQFCPSCRELVR